MNFLKIEIYDNYIQKATSDVFCWHWMLTFDVDIGGTLSYVEHVKLVEKYYSLLVYTNVQKWELHWVFSYKVFENDPLEQLTMLNDQLLWDFATW